MDIPATVETKPLLPGVGIFGCGPWIHLLVSRLRSFGFSVEALWAFQTSTSAFYAKELKISFHTDKVDHLLLHKRVQVILIFSPQQALRSEIVAKAFRIGKHVICHWPPATTIQESYQLCAAASYYPSLISFIFYPLRALAQFEQLRKLLRDRKYIGELASIDVRLSGRQLFDLGILLQQQNHVSTSANIEQSLTCKSCRKIILNPTTNTEGGNDPRSNHLSYQQRMCSGGVLTSLAPHLIDVLSYVSGFRAKRVSAMLRTFGNVEPFYDSGNNAAGNNRPHLDSIRRVTVDDFCHFQMELVKHQLPSNRHQSRKPSTTGSTAAKKEFTQNKENQVQNHQQQIKTESKTFTTATTTTTNTTNSAPVAMVSIEAHRNNAKFSCELILSGTLGYIWLRDGQIFGRQYEQNNNQTTTADEEPELLKIEQEISSNDKTKDVESTFSQLYCHCLAAAHQQNCHHPLGPETKVNGQISSESKNQESHSKTNLKSIPPKTTSFTSSTNSAYHSWWRGYSLSCERLVQELNDLFVHKPNQLESCPDATERLQRSTLNANQKSSPAVNRDNHHQQRVASFEDALYVQNVVEAIRKSAHHREWARVESFDPKLIPRILSSHRKLH